MRRFRELPPVVKIVLVIVGVTIAIVVVGGLVFARSPGPRQPIPFSHRIHVDTKNISCFFCHQYATRSSNAGIPSVDKCLLCHNVIATRFPPIALIKGYEQRNEPIPWVKVTVLPDFVQFKHQPHLAAGTDCSRCHGNVARMDRVRQVNEFSMAFCVDCHRERGASIECYACHY